MERLFRALLGGVLIWVIWQFRGPLVTGLGWAVLGLFLLSMAYASVAPVRRPKTPEPDSLEEFLARLRRELG